MSGTRDERIRQRAHKIWLEAGQPEGMDQAHWLAAEKDIDKQDKASAKAPGKAKPADKKVAAAPQKKKSPVKTAKPKAKG